MHTKKSGTDWCSSGADPSADPAGIFLILYIILLYIIYIVQTGAPAGTHQVWASSGSPDDG